MGCHHESEIAQVITSVRDDSEFSTLAFRQVQDRFHGLLVTDPQKFCEKLEETGPCTSLGR